MPLLVGHALAHLVAVGPQHRVLLLVGDDGGGELGHHVRTVGIEGDLAEAFRLALGIQVAAAGGVQPHQAAVGHRVDLGFHIQNEAVRHVGDAEAIIAQAVGVGGQHFTVQLQRQQRSRAVQLQHVGRSGRRIAVHDQARTHAHQIVVEDVEGQVDLVHQIGRHLIVLPVLDLGLLAHAMFPV
ncbi:hypothetical protein D3C72_1469130 [compost metagenome]